MQKVFRNGFDGLSKKDQQRAEVKATTKFSPETLLLARNLVEPHYTEQQHRSTKDGTPIPEDSDISRMLKAASSSVRDARNILKSSPELCMGIDIYIAGLLSPNDVSRPELNITSNLSGELEGIKSALLDVVRDWAKNDYKIDGRLKDWVFRAKYLAGAMPIMVVPLTEIDNIINETDDQRKQLKLESYDSSKQDGYFSKGFFKSTGILGAGLTTVHDKKRTTESVFKTLKMESADNGSRYDSFVHVDAEQKKRITEMFKDAPELATRTVEALNNIYIHDNPEIFKVPRIAQAIARKQILHRFSPLDQLAQESGDNTENKNIVEANGRKIELQNGELVYPDRHFETREVISLRPVDIYDNVGHPMPIELPYDSCFPVSPPGLPEKHIGYIVALDSSGNPLTLGEESLSYPDPSDIAMQTASGVMGTQVLQQTADNSIDGISNLRYGNLNNASNKIFNTYLISDIKERLKNGLYQGVELDIRFTQVFLEQMWKRAMVGQQVQFLFVPVELLTYIAFEYNELGMGESKLIKHKDIAIIASTVQIANALASINNAIQHKKVTIDFGEDEIDAFDTDEKLKQYITRAQWASTLFTSSNTQDQLNQILNSGYHFVYENGNGAFPDTRFDIEYLTREAAVVENEYLDTVNKRLIMLSGVSPEIVDMSQEVEFAQTYITGHMLRAQQASIEQEALCTNTTKFIKSFVLHSQIILKKLLEIIKKYRVADKSPIAKSKKTDADLVREFIESIETSLPKPDTSKLNMQKENLATHEEIIDKCIEYYFDDPLFESSEIGEKLGEKRDLFKSVFKMSYMRSILQTNNLVPPQFQMLHGDVDEENMIDPFIESETIIENFSKLALQHEAQVAKLKVKNDETVQRIEDGNQPTEGGSDDGMSDTSTEDTSTDDTAADSGDGSDGGESDDTSAEDDLFGDGGEGGSDNPLG